MLLPASRDHDDSHRPSGGWVFAFIAGLLTTPRQR